MQVDEPRRPSVLGTIGAAVLGLVGGGLAGVVVQDLVASALVAAGDLSLAAAVGIALVVPVCALLGAGLGVVLTLARRPTHDSGEARIGEARDPGR
ncbi:hypothetical protein [Agrococcus jejuensis]|uniref:Uncharacterized protein n=1 Tax=Agrococcus jejuensis TaxID=399736 RepID=A0A1G8FUZ8_9MICO|nr:hypothetical protein [Agrococcus jejuensis]SDH85955.1 hypothetical protein SAMN04489720_2628 [Agrococcus jejuensis]